MAESYLKTVHKETWNELCGVTHKMIEDLAIAVRPSVLIFQMNG